MRPLLIDDEAKAKAKRMIEFAEAHPWFYEQDSIPPSDPGYRGDFSSYEVIFTMSHGENRILRQISVAVPAPGKWPSPISVFMLADLFGFPGWTIDMGDRPPKEWMLAMCECGCRRLSVGLLVGAIDKSKLS